jgi:hypothetical protein
MPYLAIKANIGESLNVIMASRASSPRAIHFPALSVNYDPSACFFSTPFTSTMFGLIFPLG